MMVFLFLALGAALGLGFRAGALVVFSALAFAVVIIGSASGGEGLLPALIDAAITTAALQAGYLLSILVKAVAASRAFRTQSAQHLNRIGHPPAGGG